jgi:queuine tRNA-ribosyltransferase
MSLAERRTLDESGVTFASHLDGRRHRLTPERAIEIQDLLDATVTMVLDECTPYPIAPEAAAASMRRSLRWAERSRAAYRARQGYGLFGIVQGSVLSDLRAESASALVDVGFDGYAIGGLAVGEPQTLMFEVLGATVPALPADRPRYLMGVGRPEDLAGAVVRGIDLFDCVLPTRSGRTAQAWTRFGPLNLRNARHADDPRPLAEESPWPAAQNYSRAYLHHLVRSGETLGAMLLSEINVAYYQQLMQGMRAAIASGTFEAFKSETRAGWARGDIAPK